MTWKCPGTFNAISCKVEGGAGAGHYIVRERARHTPLHHEGSEMLASAIGRAAGLLCGRLAAKMVVPVSAPQQEQATDAVDPGPVTLLCPTVLLQTRYNEEDERAIVNGAHTNATLQQLVHKYVELFVLCPNCRLPESSES